MIPQKCGVKIVNNNFTVHTFTLLNSIVNERQQLCLVRAHGAHRICLCSRLLFYSNCTGYTVRLTYTDISPAMYINQWQVNVELPYLWCKTVFWAILKEVEVAVAVNGELKLTYHWFKRDLSKSDFCCTESYIIEGDSCPLSCHFLWFMLLSVFLV